MWLFDNVIAEEETTQTSASQTQTSAPSTDDGTFLIFDDTPMAASASTVKAEDIPDSAVSFLDFSAMEQVTATEAPAPEAKEEFSMFLDNASETSAEASAQNEVETKEESITMIEESKEEAPFFGMETPEIKVEEPASMMFEPAAPAPEAKVADPYAILDKAIWDLETLLKWHEAVRTSKMANVDSINEQIATLKQEAKKLTEEAKEISLEEEKVNKMIDTFKAQKV